MSLLFVSRLLCYAAAHCTMNKHYDVDEMFGFLVDHDPMFLRAHDPFSEDHRR